jgi:ABC-type multidrug transport system permease subunit
VFVAIAPIVVMTVAGFSLANLFGAGPRGQSGYVLPFVDEDGGALGQEILARLREQPSVQVRPVATRAEAERLVRSKEAGTAIVIPAGTDAALDAGRPASLVLYTDPVRYLERLNVRAELLALRNRLANERVERARADAEAARARLAAGLARLDAAIAEARTKLDAAWAEAAETRDRAARALGESLARARREAETAVRRAVGVALADVEGRVNAESARVRGTLRAYLVTVEARRQEFRDWLERLQKLAGGHARDIPPPPDFPALPPEVRRLVDDGTPLDLPSAASLSIRLPAPPRIEPPPLPPAPAFDVPDLTLPAAPPVPGTLDVVETTVGGIPVTINTFDENVPGFSVTFLLLGMLLGVSLALVDERDWGTLARVRTMPVPASQILVGKLLARFLVGLVQMAVLLAFGWVAFDMSLGPQPWALLLPTVGIVFAGTAFGLIVAGAAPSREAIIPAGAVVIVTMAAIGGCWWPIDLEPRWMRTVALAFPTTWAMEAYNDLMMRHRGVEAALVPTAVMLAYGLAYLAIGVALFRRRAG